MPPRKRGGGSDGAGSSRDPHDPHQVARRYPHVRFERGTQQRDVFYHLCTRRLAPTRTFDWDLLERLGERARTEAIVGADDATPFRRMFDAAYDTAYLELTLEFLSTFRFTPHSRDPESDIDARTHQSVHFSLFGQSFSYTLFQWATTALGFYTPEEIMADEAGFYFHDEVGIEGPQAQAWWPRLSGQIWRDPARATQILDMVHRYIHRCIAGTIAGRGLSTERVPTPDIFFLRALIEPVRVNLAYAMALYLDGVILRPASSPIVCGAFITHIARRIDRLTPPILALQTEVVPPERVDYAALRAMKMAFEVDGEVFWSQDYGRTRWVLPAPADAAAADPAPDAAAAAAPAPDAAAPPPPPPVDPVAQHAPPPPPPHIWPVIRQIPTSVEFRAETLHLLRQMHTMAAASLRIQMEWARQHGIPHDPMPDLPPYVPQPDPGPSQQPGPSQTRRRHRDDMDDSSDDEFDGII